ncbi:MAG: chemotaxis response regulator protein-glutamate methylesterase [Verrucomicrobiota bacterium]|jgi:chemotaxis response regulator CheB
MSSESPFRLLLVTADSDLAAAAQQVAASLRGMAPLERLPSLQAGAIARQAPPDMLVFDQPAEALLQSAAQAWPECFLIALAPISQRQSLAAAGAHGVTSRSPEALRNALTTSLVAAMMRKKTSGSAVPKDQSAFRLAASAFGHTGSSENVVPALGSLRPAPAPVSIIAVAISTGGPQALQTLLPAMPENLPVPILIVQHIPAGFTEDLAHSLARNCKIGVAVAAEGQLLLPGRAYIAPGGRQLAVIRSVEGLPSVRLSDDPPENHCRPAADFTFRSLGRSFGPSVLGVIMTGMGADGAFGLKQLKDQHKCLVFAQDQATSIVYGMPGEAVRLGVPDAVLPLASLAPAILAAVKSSRRGG